MVQLSRASAHSGCKVSSQGVPNRTASSLRPRFVEASPTVEKQYRRYQASNRSSLVVCEFCAGDEERCEQG